MEENNMVAIIVLIYNVEKYVKKCLTSLVNQIYISFYMTVAMFLNIHYLIKNKEKIENEKIDN